MAGMLPGVESARRRRVHGGTRRPPLSLYTSSHEKHQTYTTPSLRRSVFDQAYKDEDLGGAAREAKERLDERLGVNRSSETKRSNNKDCTRYVEGRSMVLGKSHIEALRSKQSGSERFSWVKLSWKPWASCEMLVCHG
ncbi:hypothetical protein I3843_15G158100 [Carya illinoinensis]|uniref:Uncharacterized protein n=1 Tax=Carya illinoinensis TaxID=32201 RepID=A0A8T1NGF7_CARIL|nr:uncharacterized protein LOC122295627 isoform X1 [Carya illinoinensis]KAG6628164.1 hypothetical protein CIPAW_15G182700 [Carya illinoinensis]KAG6676739.1 hypothetical protein I3842_15G166500 [Carya illinoinensis]KAG7945550.1 hypothetical protein I3843_15G158100 [Carya illinoinensis]